MGKVATLVKYSQALGRTICDKVEDGITIAEQCRQEGFVSEKTIYRWKKQYPEFDKQLEEAYRIFFIKKIDEIEYLSTKPLPEGMDKVALNAEINMRRLRIDTLKFILAKIAPRFVHELKDSPTTAIAVMPQIQIINYGDKDDGKKD